MSRKTPAHHGGKTTDYRVALLRNQVTDFLGHEKITTTEMKAKQVRSLAEKMITLGKRGGLHNRRQAMAYLYRREVTEKLFAELAQRYANRAGGYMRITKIGPRLGDNAEMVLLELVK